MPDPSAMQASGRMPPGARTPGAVWDALRAAMRDPTLAPQLQAAADGVHLGLWTELLTAMVVRACARLGWECAAKGTAGAPLPVGRAEYLGIDVLAFPPGQGWRPPVAAFELENARRNDLVAYALWKVCSVRADLACLACYRVQSVEVAALVGTLQDAVLRPLHVRGRRSLSWARAAPRAASLTAISVHSAGSRSRPPCDL